MFGINQSMARRVQENNHNAKQEKQMLDGIKEAAAQVTADPISERSAIAVIGSMRMAALSVVLQTALILDEGQDEDNEMLPNELLDSLTLEAFDDGEEDDGSDIDSNVKAILSANIADAFSSLGVDDDIINDVFSTDLDVADTAITSACATVIENLPPDGEPLDEFTEQFVYGYDTDADEDTEVGLDGVMFDKASGKQKLTVGKTTTRTVGADENGKGGRKIRYKAMKAVRHGKVVIINKRISGHVILSSAQKSALKKAKSKSHTAKALRKAMFSLAKGLKHKIYHENDYSHLKNGQGFTVNKGKALQNAFLTNHNKVAFK